MANFNFGSSQSCLLYTSFQDPFSSLNPRYTVFELIASPLKTFHLCHGKAELEDKVFELMDTVGLARRFAYSYPHEPVSYTHLPAPPSCCLPMNPPPPWT